MDYWYDLINSILIFAIFAISLNLLIGYTGQVSVAHAAFGAVGGYTAAYISLHHGYPFFLTLVIGVAVASIWFIGGRPRISSIVRSTLV